MANYGDIYSYSIDINATGVQETNAARDAVRKFGMEAERSGQKARQMGGAFSTVGPTIFQMANFMEDAQFGARALGNNLGMLVSTMGGFSPVAMALGGVLQVLAAVFRDNIDEWLAAAGILDKNLIPKTKEAEDAIKGMGEAASKIPTDFEHGALAAQKFASAIEGLISQVGGPGADRPLLDAIIGESAPLQSMLEQASKEVADAAENLKRVRDQPAGMNIGNEAIIALGEAQTRYNVALDQTVKVRQRVDELARQQFEKEVKQAQSRDEALVKLIHRYRELGQASGNQDFLNLADELEKQTEAFRKLSEQAEFDAKHRQKRVEIAEDELKAQQRLTEELIRQGKENEEYTREVVAAADERARAVEEEERRKVEAAKQARLDDRTRLAVQSFGPMISGQIGAMLQQAEASGMGREQANAAAIDQTMQFLMRAGLDTRTAGSTAQALVEEQSGLIQELAWGVDAMVGMMRESLSGTRWNRQVVERTLGNVRRLQIMSQNMNPRRNNRANGL